MTSVALPRPVAARITVHGLATTQRVIAVVGSLVAGTIAIDVLATYGALAAAPVVMAPFIGLGMLALLLLWRPTVLVAAVFVLGGAVFSAALPTLLLPQLLLLLPRLPLLDLILQRP